MGRSEQALKPTRCGPFATARILEVEITRIGGGGVHEFWKGRGARSAALSDGREFCWGRAFIQERWKIRNLLWTARPVQRCTSYGGVAR